MIPWFSFFDAGTNRGLWEISSDFERQSQLTISSTVAISVSVQWLVIALESGELALFKGGHRQWVQYSATPKNPKDPGYCYTSLLVHNKPEGWLRILK